MSDHDLPSPSVRLERVGTWRYVARNDLGAELRVGTAGTPDHFTPGELLQLALAACSVLSADHVFASRLGEDFEARADVTARKADDGDRYDRMLVNLAIDLGSLEPERREALLTRATRAIDRLCGVGHTLSHPEPLPYEIHYQDGA